MNFFRDVVSHLLKNAFEGHTQFSVADNTAVGDNPIRSISLDAVPLNENVMISLAWEGGEKVFEKTLSEQEASHQFDLISSDLAEVAALTKQGQYDAAKDLMKKLGQKYAENTGDIVQTNLPKLHNTQASLSKKASTDYYFEVPVSINKLKKLKDLRIENSSDGLTATDGENYVHLNVEDNGLVSGCTRFGGNDPSMILDILSYVAGDIKDEHEMQDIWYEEADVEHAKPDHVCDEDCLNYDSDAADQAATQVPAPAPVPAKKQPKRRSSLDTDGAIWKQAKITMQNLWFSDNQELLEYQKLQKKPNEGAPLWDQNKGAKPAAPKGDGLAPASLSYEDKENQKAQEHEDMQKHIDEKIKTELESALQEKAASVFGPDQVELVQILKKNGRNWDEIKKILVKDFGFDKEAVTIFVDEQRQGADPQGIEVEPVEEVKPEDKALTPPEDLVSPETHDKLLQDHEDKKKDKSLITDAPEQNFSPKDVMDIPEDEEIVDESSLDEKKCPECSWLSEDNFLYCPNCSVEHAKNSSQEIARADNDDIRKVASDEKCDDCGHLKDFHSGRGHCDKCKKNCGYKSHKKASNKTAAPSDLNPLQEPIEQHPTTSNTQDTVPMGKKPQDHAAPQRGDRVFVSSDLTGEKAGFEGMFISTYKSQGTDFAIVETDDGDMLDIELNRVVKTGDGDSSQSAEPAMAPVIEQQQPSNEIPVTPKMDDFHTSAQNDELIKIKAELAALTKIVKEADDEQLTMWDERGYDEKYPMMAKYPEMADKVVNLIKEHGDNWYKIEQKMFYDSPFYMMNLSKEVGSREGGQLIQEAYKWLKEHESGADKVWTPRTYDEIEASLKTANNKIMVRCEDCNKKFHTSPDSGVYKCPECNVKKEAGWHKNKKCPDCGSDDTTPKAVGDNGTMFHCLKCSHKWTVKEASLKKEAGTTWHDLRMPEPPQAGWRVQHTSGLTGTVVDGNDKFANVKLDQPIKPEQLRELNISEVQFGRGEHPEGVYAIYAGDGFGSWNGSTPAWTMMDSGGKPIYPKGYQPPKPMDHYKNPNDEPAIDTESAKAPVGEGADFGTADYPCEECGSPVREAGWSLCDHCNKDYEARENAKTAELPAEHVCEQCKQPMGYQGFLGPVCDKCVRKNHKKVTGSDFEKGISQNKDAGARKKCTICDESFTPITNGQVYCSKDCSDADKLMTDEASLKTAYDSLEKGISQPKTADPVDPTKTKFRDVKITPKYVPKQEATPATPEINAVLSKMDVLQQNLATLASAREQIEAKMQEELAKVDQQGERVQMEAELQESIEKAAILINAVDSKIVEWKDKLFTLQTEDINYVPKLGQKELLAKIYAKFDGAEKYVKDVLNGMLSLGKMVQEKTLYRWPNKKSSINKEATILDDMNHYNEELMAALQALSSPI